jgi:hypothetical protein
MSFSKNMISIKKYLDMDSHPESEPKFESKSEPKSHEFQQDTEPKSTSSEFPKLQGALLESYRSVVRSMADNGIRACPAAGPVCSKRSPDCLAISMRVFRPAQYGKPGNRLAVNWICGVLAPPTIPKSRQKKSRNCSLPWPKQPNPWSPATTAIPANWANLPGNWNHCSPRRFGANPHFPCAPGRGT